MKKLFLLSLLFLTLFACRNNVDETLSVTDTPNDPTTTIIDYTPEVIPVTATLFGTVTDESGTPMAGANVTLNNNTETTDEKGRFFIKNTAMNAAGTFVEVNLTGYFPGSHRFFPKDGSINYTAISLLTKTTVGSFTSSEGAVVTSPEGIQLEFPANSIVSSDNTVYQGTVEVAARWIDPTADDLQSIMPGGLQGVNTNGEEVALASFGMMAVELESPQGDALNLGNNLNATLTFPVPAELAASAPAEIPLWYFDETYGLWVQEGSAKLEGGQYVGDVAHFSFWNCDFPFPLVELSGTVMTNNGEPFANSWLIVNVQIGNTIYGAGAWADENGYFSGKVPQNEDILLRIYDQFNPYDGCGALYDENIGQLTEDTDLGIITIVEPQVVNVSGTLVNCDGNQVTNGWVDIIFGTREYSYYVDDGTFSKAIYNCEAVPTVSIVGGSLDDLEQSVVLDFDITDPAVDVGEIAACGTFLTEFLTIDLDGEVTTFAEVDLGIYGPDSTFLNAYIPGLDHYVSLGMDEITTTGTFPGSIVQYAGMTIPSGTGLVSTQCGPGGCGITEVVITELGNVGEEVIGTFSGTSDFIDEFQQTVTLSYTASFKVIRN